MSQQTPVSKRICSLLPTDVEGFDLLALGRANPNDSSEPFNMAEVRQYLRDNALMRFEEYHVDGLRWDMGKRVLTVALITTDQILPIIPPLTSKPARKEPMVCPAPVKSALGRTRW